MSVLIFPCSGNAEGKKLTEKNLSKYLSSWIGTDSFVISRQLSTDKTQLRAVECVVGGRYINITDLSNPVGDKYLHLYYYADSGNIYTEAKDHDDPTSTGFDGFIIDDDSKAETKTVTINNESETLRSYTLDLTSTPKLFPGFTIDGGHWNGSNFV